MAVSKKVASAKPKPSTKSTGHSTSAKEAEPEAEYDPNEGRLVLLELQARHGKVDDEHRAAFDSLGNEADRVKTGGRTRAAAVLGESVTWAVQIDQAFTKYPAVVEAYYSRERFTYLLDRGLALDATLSGHGASRDGTGQKKLTAEERVAVAGAERRNLIATMEGVAGARPVERGELDAAKGTAENLGQSIRDLVKLGREWLARKDRQVAILCKSARLTEASLASALAAAENLTSTGKDAKLAGRKLSADPPEVNLIEGWVLDEMAEAQRCFGRAHDASSLVPRLHPTRATRSVLGTRKAPRGGDAAPEEEAPAGGEGAAVPKGK